MSETPAATPPWRSTTVSIVALLIVPVALVGVSPRAFVVALLGCLVFVVGAVLGARRAVTLGAATAFVAVLLAATLVQPPVRAILGAAAAFVAWDTAEFGIGLAEQVGDSARTRQAEFAHVLLSGGIGTATVVAGYVVYRSLDGTGSLTAVSIVLVGVVLLVAYFRE